MFITHTGTNNDPSPCHHLQLFKPKYDANHWLSFLHLFNYSLPPVFHGAAEDLIVQPESVDRPLWHAARSQMEQPGFMHEEIPNHCEKIIFNNESIVNCGFSDACTKPPISTAFANDVMHGFMGYLECVVSFRAATLLTS